MRSSLKFAKRIEDTSKAKDLESQKHNQFWKSVSKINQNSQLHATTIDSINGEANGEALPTTGEKFSRYIDF